jgi:hypothetical protein
MVTCVRCGKNLAKECSCFASDVERIKEWGRLAQREIDVIVNVLEHKKPLYMRLLNEATLTVAASIEPMRNGIIATAKFSLITQGVKNFNRLELLDWNKDLIYFRPENVTLEKTMGSKTQYTCQWKLEIITQ